jgi:hypothetical protein
MHDTTKWVITREAARRFRDMPATEIACRLSEDIGWIGTPVEQLWAIVRRRANRDGTSVNYLECSPHFAIPWFAAIAHFIVIATNCETVARTYTSLNRHGQYTSARITAIVLTEMLQNDTWDLSTDELLELAERLASDE